MTVVDATNLRAANRKGYRQMAARYGVPAVAVAFDLAAETYHARVAGRGARQVEAEVVEDQVARMPGVLEALADEGYLAVNVLTDVQIAAGVAVERVGPG